MIRTSLCVLTALLLAGCSLTNPAPQDIFRASKGINVQSVQTNGDYSTVKFTTGTTEHEIGLACELPKQDGPEVPFLDRLLTRIKDNFILIAAAIALL